jgi:hypothetical protein
MYLTSNEEGANFAACYLPLSDVTIFGASVNG